MKPSRAAWKDNESKFEAASRQYWELCSQAAMARGLDPRAAANFADECLDQLLERYAQDKGQADL